MRKRQLDGLRFFAFLGVYFSHTANLRMVHFGSYGIDLFFALSGFLITRMLVVNDIGSVSDELKTFYVRRTLRIVPVYYAYLTILVLLKLIRQPLPYYLFVLNWKIIFDVPFVKFAYFWTLSVEEQYYLVFPFLLLITPPKWRLTLLITLVWISEFCSTVFWRPYFFPITLGRTALMWGSLAGYIEAKHSNRKLNGEAMFVVGLLLTVIGVYVERSFNLVVRPFYVITEPCRAIGFTLLVWGLWRAENKNLLAPFKFAPIAYLGQISYGLYLFHLGCFWLCLWLFKMWPWLALCFEPVSFALVLTIAQAMLSWHFFEKPINDLKDRFKFQDEKSTELPK